MKPNALKNFFLGKNLVPGISLLGRFPTLPLIPLNNGHVFPFGHKGFFHTKDPKILSVL